MGPLYTYPASQPAIQPASSVALFAQGLVFKRSLFCCPHEYEQKEAEEDEAGMEWKSGALIALAIPLFFMDDVLLFSIVASIINLRD